MSVRDFLESINLFYEVGGDFLDYASNLCKTKKYPKSSMIILEEEYGD